jgi:hypothetical protein
MYCTFVLFVNQHFQGLPASGTHCTSIIAPYSCTTAPLSRQQTNTTAQSV